MIDKYKQAFQEEAREILVDLESALLELNENRDDTELVGRVFRALHTIKGSGAMFGFDAISAFTHDIENVFDQIRNGRLRATPDLINLSLSAVDQIKTMLNEAAGQGSADAALCATILTKLRALTGVSEAPADPQRAAEAKSSPVRGPGNHEWHISFRPGVDLLRHGTNPLLLLRELRQLGTLQVKADTSSVPAIAELDPERCYIAWNMVLRTAAGADEVRDVFIFVEGSCELVVEAAPCSSQPAETVHCSAGRDALPRGLPLPGQANAGFQHSCCCRQTRPTGRPRGSTRHRASPIGRGRRPPRRSRHASRGRRD